MRVCQRLHHGSGTPRSLKGRRSSASRSARCGGPIRRRSSTSHACAMPRASRAPRSACARQCLANSCKSASESVCSSTMRPLCRPPRSPIADAWQRTTIGAMVTAAIDLELPVRDIAPSLLDEHGTLCVVPASVLSATTAQERLALGLRHGLYSYPTEELVAFLRERIGGRRAIEIGAGNGVLAKTLGIPATDNRQQEEAEFRAYYAARDRATVQYGDDVEKLDAAAAVKKHRPQVVVACWVTHRYDPRRPRAGGSVTGVNEEDIVQSCEEYIFIGNEQVHEHKSIWSLPHEKLAPSWLYSRAVNGSPNFIAVWRRDAQVGARRRASTQWPWA